MNKTHIGPMNNPDKIINYWKKEKVIVLLLSIFGVLYNTGMVLRPIYQGKLIDALINEDSLINLINLSFIYVILISLVQFFRYLKRYYVRQFANRTTATMRFMINNSILFKKGRELKEENMGSLMTKAISDVDVCVEGMRKATTEIFDTGVLLITYIATLLRYDVKITLLSCTFIPLAVFIAERLKKYIFKFTKEYRLQISRVSDITYDRIDNAILYRLYGREEPNREKYIRDINTLEKKAIIANIWENAMQPIYNVISMIGIMLVIIFMGRRVIEGSLTVGIFSTYISIFSVMALKASRVAKLFNTIQKSTVSWNRIKPYLQQYKELDTKFNIYNDKTDLNIKDLCFAYNDKEYIIKNMSFKCNSGQIIGITGPVGCGKSTLGRIFLGEYDYEGVINIDNRQLKDYLPYERSHIISYIGHDYQLISDTIYNNITLGDDGDISHVLNVVCFNKDLRNMENGINTIVGNGGIRLSGGQQGRIALARALYHSNKILILDDPFSAVDINTEREIYNNLRKYYKDKLIIIISHRLSLFDDLDNIVLINEDKTSISGKHAYLLKTSELYNVLYNLKQGKAGEYSE